MVRNRTIGLALLLLTVAGAGIYVGSLFYLGRLITEVTVVISVLAFLFLIGWIGYTIFTEPPTRAKSLELDKLESETVRPAGRTEAILDSRFSVIVDSTIGEGTEIRDQVNLYKCRIGMNCKVESFTYIEEGVVVGDRCKIKPNVYIPTGVTIENDVFIGPNTTFTNDKHPSVSGEWTLSETLVCEGASIGAHVVVLPGIRIGKKAVVGGGAVVTKDVPDGEVVVGNPAHVVRKVAFQLES